MNHGRAQIHNMISFFIKCDVRANIEFTPLLWGENGFGDFLDFALRGREYGSDIKLLLIMFYVEGELPMWLPKKIRSLRYNKKEHSVAVEVPVYKNEYHEKSPLDRCKFIVHSVFASIHAVKPACQRNDLDLNLELLLEHVEDAGQRWLELRRDDPAL